MSLVIKRGSVKFYPKTDAFRIFGKALADSSRVGRAAILRGLGSVGHAVVAENARYAEAVIGKHA